MNGNDNKYNKLENNIIYIKENFKKKGKEYGIMKLNKRQINALVECIDLQSVSPLISPKFSQRIEQFLLPRIDEISSIIYSLKPFPEELGIEISKENYTDILKGLTFSNVLTGLKDRGYNAEELNAALKKIIFYKYK
ncbi:MAG: hypothetical protein ACFE92_11360 [Promethearchaeota archaeon]